MLEDPTTPSNSPPPLLAPQTSERPCYAAGVPASEEATFAAEALRHGAAVEEDSQALWREPETRAEGGRGERAQR